MDKALIITQFLEMVRSGEIQDKDFACGCLDEHHKELFKNQYDYVNQINGSECLNGIDTREDNAIKGKALEQLVKLLFESTGNYYNVLPNLHTSINEIDVLAVLNNKGLSIIQGYYGEAYRNLLCECKNYQKEVGVTYVGKFTHLTFSSNVSIGILFSWYGFSKNAIELVKKAYYIKGDSNAKVYIINFAKPEFERILLGESFFNIIREKCTELEIDVDFQKYYKKHPREDQLISSVNNILDE